MSNNQLGLRTEQLKAKLPEGRMVKACKKH